MAEKDGKTEFDEKVEKFKAKAAIGLFIAQKFFARTILPKAKELANQARQTIEEALAKNGTSLEATLKAKREALIGEGLTAKEADEAIERLVKRTLKGSGSKKEKGGDHE